MRKILEKTLRIRKRLVRKKSKSHMIRMTPKNLKKTQKKVVTHLKKMNQRRIILRKKRKKVVTQHQKMNQRGIIQRKRRKKVVTHQKKKN